MRDETNTVLVIGGTGLVGAPVARALQADGVAVRLLTRDVQRARAYFGSDFRYVQGDVADAAALERALDGCSGVHISLSAGPRARDLEQVEYRGSARIAEIAARIGVRRLTYVSGFLGEESAAVSPETATKLRAERAIAASGIPYTIFKPTYFMETLARHIQATFAVVLGRQSHPLHMVAADDFARQVVTAFRTTAAAGKTFYVQGPEPIRITDALRLYCALVKPGTRVVTVPLEFMSLIDATVARGRLGRTLTLMRLLQLVGELGDPSEANRLLGPNTTTLRDWCQQRVPGRHPSGLHSQEGGRGHA
jgi:uncharacterized protein YbjT (DUF2867 family)